MATQPANTLQGDYKVADIDLAEFGRKEIKIAETEMPVLWPFEKNTGHKSRLRMLVLQAVCT